MAKIDCFKCGGLHENAIRLIVADMDAATMRDGLQLIDEMSRNQLLAAHGWDASKDNTERVRQLARARWLAHDPHFDVWVGLDARFR